MGTLGDLKARVTAETLCDDNDAVSRAVASAIRFYRGHRFWFNEGALTVTLEAGTAAYALPSTWLSPVLVTVDDGDDERQVSPWPYDEHRLVAGGPAVSTGLPYRYALFGEEIHYWPTPDRAGTSTLYAGRDLAPLAGDAESNAWTTEAEALIRQRARWAVFHDWLRDYDEADRAAAAEQRELANLRRETALRDPVRRVRPTWF